MYIQVVGGAQVLRVEVLESAVQVSMFCSVHLLVKCNTGNCVLVCVLSYSNYRDKGLQAVKHQ